MACALSRFRASIFAATAGLVLASTPAVCQTPAFMSSEEVRPIFTAMHESLPAELKIRSGVTSQQWLAWARESDAQVRARLERGEEDTLTNLLRFGVTFTKEPPIDRDSLSSYGSNVAVNTIAQRRASDLVRALTSPGSNEGILQMRVFLEQKGFNFRTPEQRGKVKAFLLQNLERMRDEFDEYRSKIKTANFKELSQLYADRGISLDTDLWPDFALDKQLAELKAKGLLKPGYVKRIAIVGPGLDFANKHNGYDFYPPQTIQPFAVIDSLLRLGLAGPKLQLVTLDISPSVNIHVKRITEKAVLGGTYTVQLPWSSNVPWSSEYLTAFTQYWKELGTQIGTPVQPVAVPSALNNAALHLRAVRIRSEIVARVKPVNMNIVFQRLPLAEPDKFDLIIGTNIFIYYGPFEQALARANVSSMLKTNGLLLTNELLEDKVSSGIVEAARTEIIASTNPLISEHMICYRKDNSRSVR